MRTLKKTLSLVLVVAMVLGLCVVGASAKNAVDDFTDADKIGTAYTEAVGVMTGIGVIKGMGDGTLSPTGNYTRAQAAKIITYMLIGEKAAESLVCTTAPFEDVAANHWAAGYIAFCVEQGIIDGMSATTFEPEGQLTGFQWAKMLLCAVGFGSKGEFVGSSWSLNTAKVAHNVGLFDGDLAGADHVALQRQQAILYAFNVLTEVGCVVYSEALGDYVYSYNNHIFDRYTYEGTLGWNIYKLDSVTGVIVDNEGMGASATYVDSVVAADGNVKVVADTGLDMMYHAARVWYVEGTKTNTGVYVYDLAKVESTTCPTIATLPTTNLRTIGSINATPYQLDVVDNSAIDGGKLNVITYASFGQLGYTDKALKTTVVGGTPVDTADIMTDISDIDYLDPIVYISAASTYENAEAWYVYAVTATSGVIQSVSQAAGNVVSVTLSDGTVLKKSNLDSNRDTEYYVVGNVYAFVLDTHGDFIFATRDLVRDLWAYTGEWKWTSEHDAISTDRVRADRFINVTTGEEQFFPVNFVDMNDTNDDSGVNPTAGQYYDISATPNSDGDYIAELINAGNNTYAAGYIVDNWTVVENDTTGSLYRATGGTGTVYFDGETVTFLVASGEGKNMTVTPYVGIQALKAKYNVATNGTIWMSNTAMTVSRTSTGNWNASVIFVFESSLRTTSRYVFIPTDISTDDWTTVTGGPDSYFATYSGAYLEGKKISVRFTEDQLGWGTLANGSLDRGFYVLTTWYAADGEATYWLGERIDNARGQDCYYLDVELIDTGIATTNAWQLEDSFGTRYDVRDNEVDITIIDLTNPNHEIASLKELYEFMDTHDGWSLAFTVNPDNDRVDYIYVVNVGWDAQVTISLTAALQEADWEIYSINGVLQSAGTVSRTFNDAAAENLVGGPIDVVLYNEALDGVSATGPYKITMNGVYYNDSALNHGYIGLQITVPSMATGEKDYTFTIGGLVLEDVELTLNNTAHKFKDQASGTAKDVGDIVLGTEVSFDFSQVTGDFYQTVGDYKWTGRLTSTGENTLTGTLYESGGVKYVNVKFVPITSNNTIYSGAWVEIENP